MKGQKEVKPERDKVWHHFKAKTKQNQRFTIARPQCSVLEHINRKHPPHALSLIMMLLFPLQTTNFYLIVITESGMQHGNTFSLTLQMSNDVEKNKYLFSYFKLQTKGCLNQTAS